MDRFEMVVLMASHIAGGIAEKTYGIVRGSPAQAAAADHIAELSVSIARKIIEEATKASE
jgi:hypothetical protein